MSDIHAQKILILDFGSQYTQLIARCVRELGVYCEIVSYEVSAEYVHEYAPQGVILSGGPATVTTDTTPRISSEIFTLGCPILGICYGMQAMAAQLGGQVENAKQREYGYAKIKLTEQSQLFTGIEDRINDSGQALLDVWMSHGDHVIVVPEGFSIIAASGNALIAAISDESRQYYGLQFHPEVTHTKQGKRILARFIYDICQCNNVWTASNIIADSIEHIRSTVGNDRVILGISGGVDSTVTAALLHKAIGDQLIGIFVDTGLLRLNEAQQVENVLRKHLGIELLCVDAREEFYQALSGVSDPEEKRKVIGKQFIDIFEQHAKQIEEVKWLAQGTIYPDVIESAGTKTGKTALIKSHHNVGGLPEKMHLKLLEPLRELFKDEVRQVGLTLGLPQEMIHRHPFPGPGLGVRILGEIRAEYAKILRLADAIFIEELRLSGWYDNVSQAFAVFMPIKSVGVMGDSRCYDYVIGLRAVETTDFMTAHWSHLPHDLLAHVSNRIINEVNGVSRVVYDISGKPPATIEWE